MHGLQNPHSFLYAKALSLTEKKSCFSLLLKVCLTVFSHCITTPKRIFCTLQWILGHDFPLNIKRYSWDQPQVEKSNDFCFITVLLLSLMSSVLNPIIVLGLLVAKGHKQMNGIDFHECFAPVVKITTLGELFTISAFLDL